MRVLRGRVVALTALTALMSALSAAVAVDAQQSVRRVGDEVRDAEAEAARRSTLSRLLMSRSRNVAILEREGGDVLLHTGKVKSDSVDFESLETLEVGEVQVLTGSAGTKLRTDFDLRFGDVLLGTGNVAEGYAGTYTVWLKRSDVGWSLVFNDESDIWGTQRDPERDRAEIPLEHGTVDEVAHELKPSLEEADGSGTLEIRWGTHRWTADFTVDS